MKKLLLILFVFATALYSQIPNCWINEIHYDNVGADVGEFVEIAIQNPENYNLSDFSVVLYNGNGGKSYNTSQINTYTQGYLDVGTNIQLFYSNISGIQNGSPDGIALGYKTTLIQFLSYEGTFTGLGGIADGIQSTDIGVFEDEPTTPVGSSIGLTGTGTTYDNFTWTNFSDDTPGQPNTSQLLPVELTNFDAMLVGNKVQLNWSTATEVNNYGFEILRSTQNDWQKIGFVAGHGNSNSPKDYSFTDANAPKGNVSFKLKQVDTDGNFTYSDVVTVNNALAKSFKLYSPYPNPFNPSTTIKYSIPSASNVTLKIYDVIGNEVASLVNEKKDAGGYEVNFNAKNLPSGIYFSTLRSNGNVQTQKLLLIK